LINKRKPKILVVDDQPIYIKWLQPKLERQGMDALVTYNARECLNVVKDTVPDLILSDIMMPEIDELQACQHFKSKPTTETIPITFNTTKASKEVKLEGLEAGAVDYINKPIDPEVSDTLFEPFIATKTSVGRGMGLTISRRTIQNFEGDLRVVNNPDGGVIAAITHTYFN
jgi:CheY-like chemotaxis protein